MSRSNPTTHIPNPSTRWYEWDGSNGEIRYYDKATSKTVPCGADFAFLVLDELSAVKGFHDPSNSNIFSNEVRDTREQPFVVKAKKGAIPIASGIYADIKDKVHAAGGGYSASIYLAFKSAAGLEIANLTLKGAALSVWMEFTKANRDAIYKKAVRIKGFTQHKKGKIDYRNPVFTLVDVTEQSNAEAKGCDQRLQEFFKHYFSRVVTERVAPAGHEPDPETTPDAEPGSRPEDYEPAGQEQEADDVPF